MGKQRLVIGATGATGMPILMEILRFLRENRSKWPKIESHLLVSKAGTSTLLHECGLTPADLKPYVDVLHDNDSLGDDIASGSVPTLGMLIVPCSMKTTAAIVSGFSDTLLLRAADVTLKERRKLVLCARECPLSTIHLRNLHELSQMGAIIAPPMLTYYNKPQSVEAMTRQTALRLLSCFGLADPEPWEGLE